MLAWRRPESDWEAANRCLLSQTVNVNGTEEVNAKCKWHRRSMKVEAFVTLAGTRVNENSQGKKTTEEGDF